MMFDWQTATAILIAAMASVFLLSRMMAYVRGKQTSCGGCSACPKSTSNAPALTTLTMPVRSEKRDSTGGL